MFFFGSFGLHGIWESRFSRDFTSRERKSKGNQTFPRELFGWERDIKLSSGTVWMGSREQDLHENGKKKTFPVKFCGRFPPGFFPGKEGPDNSLVDVG